MSSGYYIDLSRISIDEFQRTLSSGYILPSRQVLREDINERFDVLRSLGISDIEELRTALKTKAKVEEFALKTGIPVDYLTILRREANSYRTNPVVLGKVPGTDPKVIGSLSKIGIKNSLHMFERGKTRNERYELADETGIPLDVIYELVKLSDLSRIMGVGPIFARTIYNSGVDTVEKISLSDPQDLYERLAKLYKEQGFDKVDFVLRDIEWCIKMAKKLPRSIEW
jgi:hypothetical protein